MKSSYRIVVAGKTIPIPRDVEAEGPEAVEEYVASKAPKPKATPKAKSSTSPEEGPES